MKKKDVEPLKAKVGDVFRHTHRNDGTSLAKMGLPVTDYIVAPKGNCSKGNWVCITHGMDFDNGIQKDIHIHDRKTPCVLAWNCHEHGKIEEP